MPKDNLKPHARDDAATTNEDTSVVIDALANDRGSARVVWSLDQQDPTSPILFTHLPSGATVSTTGMHDRIVYKPGGVFDYLGEGETATDSFTYAIRLADGSFSTATVTVEIVGVNDPAELSADFVHLTEGDDAADISTSGTLTISDVDSPELFVAGTQEGAYGTFAIDENGNWTFTASSAHDEFVDTNTYADVFFVESADGTSTYVAIEIMGTAEEQPMLNADTMAFV